MSLARTRHQRHICALSRTFCGSYLFHTPSPSHERDRVSGRSSCVFPCDGHAGNRHCPVRSASTTQANGHPNTIPVGPNSNSSHPEANLRISAQMRICIYLQLSDPHCRGVKSAPPHARIVCKSHPWHLTARNRVTIAMQSFAIVNSCDSERGYECGSG